MAALRALERVIGLLDGLSAQARQAYSSGSAWVRLRRYERHRRQLAEVAAEMGLDTAATVADRRADPLTLSHLADQLAQQVRPLSPSFYALLLELREDARAFAAEDAQEPSPDWPRTAPAALRPALRPALLPLRAGMRGLRQR